MHVLLINGSPKKNGNTMTLLKQIGETAVTKEHTIDYINLYDLRLGGCIACMKCKNSEISYCAVEDDFKAVFKKIIQADCIGIGTPVYMGHVTGPVKCLIDRFYCFFSPEFKVRDLAGKKYFTVVVSGAPTLTFKEVTEYLNYWLGRFGQMELVGNLHAGKISDPGDARKNKQYMEEAQQIGLDI